MTKSTDSTAVRFVKMHGAGNDFIMLEKSALPTFPLSPQTIAKLCDRRLGIGADGLIILAPTTGRSQFRMHYFNSDGFEAEMCGNGARCAFAWAHELGMVGEHGFFATAHGEHEGQMWGPGDVEIRLSGWTDLEPSLALPEVPWATIGVCNTGVPHVVVGLSDTTELAALDLQKWGPVLRHHARFSPAGTNVNWAAWDPGTGLVHLRTFERGVEAETLACGTGAAATAVIMCSQGLVKSPVEILTRGGDILTIRVDIPAVRLFLRGPALASYHGEVVIHE